MNPSNTLPKIGDRVRIASDDMFDGRVGVVVAEDRETDPISYRVRLDGAERAYFYGVELVPVAPISAPARMLLAAWHASGRTLERVNVHTSNGWMARRYCTPDRTVDLTISTKVAS